MMKTFLEAVKNRRTHYALGKKIAVSEKEVTDLIETLTREVPSAFNMQSGRVVVAFGQKQQ